MKEIYRLGDWQSPSQRTAQLFMAGKLFSYYQHSRVPNILQDCLILIPADLLLPFVHVSHRIPPLFCFDAF